MNPHPLQAYWSMAAAAVQTRALSTALKLGVFESLKEALSAKELATKLELNVDNTAHLLDLLWSMGLLERDTCFTPSNRDNHSPRYQSAAIAKTYFLRASPLWYGDAWRCREARLGQFASSFRDQVQLGARTENTEALEHFKRQWASAAHVQLAQDQNVATVPAALEIMSRVPEFASANRLLDLGGGPGWVAIELARQQNGLSCVVFDFPDAVAVAKENVTTAGLADRIGVLGGDLATDDIGSDYDLIWCSSVLHFVPDVQLSLIKMHAALRPGGTLVCAHAEVSSDPATAAQVLQYYLPMLMQGRHVGQQGDMAAAMNTVGFSKIESFVCRMFPMVPLTVVVGRKEE